MRSIRPDLSITTLRRIAGKKQGWAEEPHIRMVAQWLGINIQCVPIDLELIEEGPQWEATVPFGKDEWEKLHLAYWTRGGLGLHFDIIKNSRTLRGNDTNDETEDQPSNTKRCRKELIEVNRKRIGPPRIPHQEDITTQPDSAVVAAEDSKKRRHDGDYRRKLQSY